MDNFYEQVVIKKNRMVNDIIYYILYVFMIISGILGLLNLQGLIYSFSWIALLYTILVLGSAVLIYLKKGEIRTEFEYTFTNGEIDYAKVFNNEKRKNLGTMNIRNVSSFGKVDSEKFRSIINTPNIRKKNWFLNRDSELYYFYFVKDDNKNIIIIEPDMEMVNLIKKYLPQGVYSD